MFLIFLDQLIFMSKERADKYDNFPHTHTAQSQFKQSHGLIRTGADLLGSKTDLIWTGD